MKRTYEKWIPSLLTWFFLFFILIQISTSKLKSKKHVSKTKKSNEANWNINIDLAPAHIFTQIYRNRFENTLIKYPISHNFETYSIKIQRCDNYKADARVKIRLS